MLGHDRNHRGDIDHLPAPDADDLGVGESSAATRTRPGLMFDRDVRRGRQGQRAARSAGLATGTALDPTGPTLPFRATLRRLTLPLRYRVTRRWQRRVPRVLRTLRSQRRVLSPQPRVLGPQRPNLDVLRLQHGDPLRQRDHERHQLRMTPPGHARRHVAHTTPQRTGTRATYRTHARPRAIPEWLQSIHQPSVE